MTYPSTFSSFARPQATDRLNSPSHSALHNAVSSSLGQVEAVIGLEGNSSMVGTLMYDVRSAASNGGGHVQTADKGGTGQTMYSKGDLLAGQSSSVLTKLAAGSDGNVLTADSTTPLGIKWGGAPPGLPSILSFTTSSTFSWLKPASFSYIVVQAQAAGAGGGGVNAGGSPGAAAGGGGGGGYGEKVYTPSMLANAPSVLVVIGGGGSGASAGDNDGNVGGDTTFSAGNSMSSVHAFGGAIGTKGSSGGGGGVGGTVTGADFVIPGKSGANGVATTTFLGGGEGGDTFWGYGGRKYGAGTGTVGSGYGGGGQGAANISATAGGGNGASGAVVITIF